ncbi:MAG: AMP-binding protein [Polyangiaceae bacterium]|nr:AMP-binding protein [Polyangiaceae bacterium]
MSLELPSTENRFESVCELFFRRAQEQPERVAYRYFERPTRQRDVSYREFSTQVRLFSLGLQALGLPPGAKVAVVAEQGPEWTIADLGVLAAGAVAVALPSGLGTEELERTLRGLEVRVVVCGCRADAEMVCGLKASLPTLEKLVGFAGAASVDGVLPLGDLMGKGRELEDCARSSRPPSSRSGAMQRRGVQQSAPEQLALVLYRGGGFVRLAHQQLVELARALPHALQLNGDDVAMPVLPMHDPAEHAVGLYARALAGVTTSYMPCARLDSLADLDACLGRINPSVLVLGPTELAHFAQRVEALGASPAQRPAFDWARRVGLEAAARRRTGTSMGMKLGAQVAVADSLVWARARELLGRKVRAVVCWGVSADAPEVEWLHASGLTVVPMQELGLSPSTLQSLGV